MSVSTRLILGVLFATVMFAADASAQASRRAAANTETPYQAYLPADCPDGSNFCRFISEDVPAHSQLEIRRVACQGWHVNAMPPSFVVIGNLQTSAGAFVRRIDFLKTTYAPANGGVVWTISEKTLMFIPADHRLRIDLNSGSGGVGSYGCTISGYLTVVD